MKQKMSNSEFNEMIDPTSPNPVGPNGHRLGYSDQGDLVEWIPGEDESEKEWPLILRRNGNDIYNARVELLDKVSYGEYQLARLRIESGEIQFSDEERAQLELAKEHALRVEEKYGKANLVWDAVAWGHLCGRLSAIEWVFGDEWDASLCLCIDCQKKLQMTG